MAVHYISWCLTFFNHPESLSRGSLYSSSPQSTGSGSGASFTAFGRCLYLPCLIHTPGPHVNTSSYQPLPLAVGIHCPAQSILVPGSLLLCKPLPFLEISRIITINAGEQGL